MVKTKWILIYRRYLADCSEVVLNEGIFPHTNAGNLTKEEMKILRETNVSMGLMLENSSKRLRDRMIASRNREKPSTFQFRQSCYEGSFDAFVSTNLPYKKIIDDGYRRNEHRIYSDSLFTREDIDQMDNSFENVEEEDVIEDIE